MKWFRDLIGRLRWPRRMRCCGNCLRMGTGFCHIEGRTVVGYGRCGSWLVDRVSPDQRSRALKRGRKK